MERRYCVYWYPTIFHTDLELVEPKLFCYEKPKEENSTNKGKGLKEDVKKRYIDGQSYIIEADISDDHGTQHHVKITLDTITRIIHICTKSEKQEKSVDITLTPEGTPRRNGLIVYSYYLDTNQIAFNIYR